MKILNEQETAKVKSIINQLIVSRDELSNILTENDNFRTDDGGLKIERQLTSVIHQLELVDFE